MLMPCWPARLQNGMTVEELLREKILVIGENLKIRRFVREEGTLATYIHGWRQDRRYG